MVRSIIPALLCAFALCLCACGSARVVSRTHYGGELALEGDRKRAMEEAKQLIQDHCQGPYTILEEGEVVVGTDTVRTDETEVTADGRLVNESRTRTSDQTEWRIRYQCGDQQHRDASPPGAVPPDRP